ncbi:MAG: hypothetical protein ABEJ02_05035 [Candidatus Paceibacteria bacterium]
MIGCYPFGKDEMIKKTSGAEATVHSKRRDSHEDRDTDARIREEIKKIIQEYSQRG